MPNYSMDVMSKWLFLKAGAIWHRFKIIWCQYQLTEEIGRAEGMNEAEKKEEDEPMSQIKIEGTNDKSEQPTTSSTLNRESSGGSSKNEPKNVPKKRRTKVPERPNISISLWGLIKNFIGQDITKIPLPVNFSEPLSMLQRLTEDLEYADLLDKAADCDDLHKQIAYVAAFTISSYSTTDQRVQKPFNPVLGETFEFDRTADLGWRIICEQVSHHPPISASFCEGKQWKCMQEFSAETKFTGNSLALRPLGHATVEFKRTGSKYTWTKVTTTVRNIIIGKLYLEHSGDMEIMGEENAKGIKCHLKFFGDSLFTREPKRKVEGIVIGADDQKKLLLNGNWDKKMDIISVTTSDESDKKYDINTEAGWTIWTRIIPPPENEKCYNFTIFASQLNEPEDNVAPTDSRRRPDQRLMEEGKWDEANAEKLRIEEKQREAKKANKQIKSPAWFKQVKTGDRVTHVYGEEYWKCKTHQDWSRCPDIFGK